MSVECKYCGSELSEGHPAVIAQKIEDNVTWGSLESDDNRWGHPEGSTFSVAGLGTVKIEAKKLKPTLDDLSGNMGYMEEDSYPQGTIYEAYIILRFGEDLFFKKTGTADSYGDISWDGILKQTKPKQITVSVWE